MTTLRASRKCLLVNIKTKKVWKDCRAHFLQLRRGRRITKTFFKSIKSLRSGWIIFTAKSVGIYEGDKYIFSHRGIICEDIKVEVNLEWFGFSHFWKIDNIEFFGSEQSVSDFKKCSCSRWFVSKLCHNQHSIIRKPTSHWCFEFFSKSL